MELTWVSWYLTLTATSSSTHIRYSSRILHSLVLISAKLQSLHFLWRCYGNPVKLPNIQQTVHIFQPEAIESQGGMKLIRKSDINIGAHVNTFFRTGIRINDGTILGTAPSR